MKRAFEFQAVSETGSVRADNQDSFLVLEENAVFCVADGMGGGSDGALASSIVCEELASSLKSVPDDVRSAIDRAMSSANARVRKHADDKGYRRMGSTAVVLVFDADDAGKAAVCHVGDSRVYRIRKGNAELLTDDHTLANQILRAGEGSWSDRLKGRESPLSHVLTKVVGTVGGVTPEWRGIDVARGDFFLICSDGVHDVMDESAISGLFASVDSLKAFSDALKREIVRRGAPDNFTYIVVGAREDR